MWYQEITVKGMVCQHEIFLGCACPICEEKLMPGKGGKNNKPKGHGGKGSPNRPSRENRPSRGPDHGPDPGWKPKKK